MVLNPNVIWTVKKEQCFHVIRVWPFGGLNAIAWGAERHRPPPKSPPPHYAPPHISEQVWRSGRFSGGWHFPFWGIGFWMHVVCAGRIELWTFQANLLEEDLSSLGFFKRSLQIGVCCSVASSGSIHRLRDAVGLPLSFHLQRNLLR